MHQGTLLFSQRIDNFLYGVKNNFAGLSAFLSDILWHVPNQAILAALKELEILSQVISCGT